MQIHCLCISRLLFRIDVPYDVVGKANHFISCSLGHLGKPFRFGLVLEWIGRKVDAWKLIISVVSMYYSIGADTYQTDGHRL